MADLDTVEIIARCLCQANELSWKLPKSTLPLDTGICHCNSCRHGTGTLGGFMACEWPLPVPELMGCSRVAFSPRADVYFCATCGTLIFMRKRTQPPWTGLALGALEDPTAICRLTMHLCLADTKDGGMSVWLDRVNGARLKKYADADLQSEFEGVTAKGGGEGNLKASCKCRGVQFEITRSRELSDKAIAAQERPSSKGKYTAIVCVCDSCRLSVGCEVMAWAFIPAVNILHDNNEPLPDPPVFGTIKHYASSEGTDRYFCGGCGAVVFLTSKRRPKLFNVAVGLFHDESGARAEDWLCYTTSTGPENASDGLKRNFLTKDLTKQMITWGR
ncbi:hypothetical protein BB8028_0007g06820 [Beauveria bassiana]|uniref:CENP-V/GFA domain-containing protein n=1 Tax=Beauveria bassiana TaxID=176275 RepID=A0A2S7YN32_BEABA|nr:hypothetical protein BB8028_0007g06820 [Beauveria bassiana]